jgi:PAS domain S-box-containing protein
VTGATVPEEELFCHMFERHSAVMLISDPSSNAITWANRAAEAFYGYPRATMMTMNLADVSLLTETEIKAETERALLDQGNYSVFTHRLASGELHTVEVHSSRVTLGKRDLLFSIIHDISERVRMEKELRNANRELDDFVHTVSHDLRIPLTPIIGYAEILQEMYRECLDERAMEFLAEIERHASGMLEMLQDLLTLALTGYLERPAEPVNGNAVVKDVLLGLGSRLATVGMSVETGKLPSLRVPKSLLYQVFNNLIGNAARYAGPGGVIEVRGERRGPRVKFSVCDHGPGIAEEERVRVFNLFYRGATGEKIEGTGVGLASVQKIAKLYGGKAWVEETPGGGCTFRVEMTDESA